MKDLDCANCAAKLEAAGRKLPGVNDIKFNVMSQKMTLDADNDAFDDALANIVQISKGIEPDMQILGEVGASRRSVDGAATQPAGSRDPALDGAGAALASEIGSPAGAGAATAMAATGGTAAAAQEAADAQGAAVAQEAANAQEAAATQASPKSQRSGAFSPQLRKRAVRVGIALAIFVVGLLLPWESMLGATASWGRLALFGAAYLLAGYDVLWRAIRNITRGQVFDENFLMSIATVGAFAIGEYPEGVAVMLFYQVGEMFQDFAVNRSRASIADMMDIAPEFATVLRDGRQVQVDPGEVAVGEVVIIKPGERVPLDGVVQDGSSQLDTAALTGESVPRTVNAGEDVISGCVNMTGALTVRVTKPYGESTVARILDLVENASDKKAETENFITRFARYYTPAVVGIAALLAVIPPLAFGGEWADWIERGLTFLVVSCPCALVISVPLSFFGGIGGASRVGVLVKGGNYLEALAKVDTVVFDKTGTLTSGTFDVVAVHPESGVSADELLSLAAHAEAYSTHPIALSIRKAYSGPLDADRIAQVTERGGHGVSALVDQRTVLVGNDKLMCASDIDFHDCELVGTILHVSRDGEYVGHVVIADVLKDDAAQALQQLKASGVKRTIMLTGDRQEVAAAVAQSVGVDEYRAQLLPQDKVGTVEELLAAKGPKERLAFVGDGINDAPVLMRSDVGIAMGAMGSDAAIEAADVVLMDDKPSKIATAIRIARKTMRIVMQNIVFALAVKLLVLVLAALGLANMWGAVFADVGVSVLAILNAMRCMRVGK